MATKHRTYIYPAEIPGLTVDNIRQLFAAIECVELIGELDTAQVVIVFMHHELNYGDALATELEHALDGRFRVIGVHVPGSRGAIPPAVEDYAYSFVIWDEGKLRLVICEEEVLWEDPGGTPRPEPDTPRRCKR